MERGKLKADGFRMSRIERRYERALAALKAIARSIGNAAFRVEDYPGSKPTSDTPAARSVRSGERHSRRSEPDKPIVEKRAGRDR
jgi:hypothetical protein